MIAVIDYGAGNLRSVYNALTWLGADVQMVNHPAGLTDAEKIILPGVGAFGAGMQALRLAGFEAPLIEMTLNGTPLLGICLGMQYLFESSNEMGQHRGLGLLKGRVVKFESDTLRIPHIGWNQLNLQRDDPLMKEVPANAYAYFVHSYYVEVGDSDDVIATTDYGVAYPSVVGRGTIWGIQCHPEKSQGVGLQFLKNFVEYRP
jgi:glutamine amidotransferase